MLVGKKPLTEPTQHATQLNQAAAAGLGEETQNSATQGSVVGREVINFDELDCVDRRESQIPPKEVFEIVGSDTQKSWNIDSLLQTRNSVVLLI